MIRAGIFAIAFTILRNFGDLIDQLPDPCKRLDRPRCLDLLSSLIEPIAELFFPIWVTRIDGDHTSSGF